MAKTLQYQPKLATVSVSTVLPLSRMCVVFYWLSVLLVFKNAFGLLKINKPIPGNESCAVGADTYHTVSNLERHKMGPCAGCSNVIAEGCWCVDVSVIPAGIVCIVSVLNV